VDVEIVLTNGPITGQEDVEIIGRHVSSAVARRAEAHSRKPDRLAV
jgi:hypothetical protein